MMKRIDKNSVLVFICAFLVPVMVFTGIFLFVSLRYKNEMNESVAALIAGVKENCPDMSDEEILAFLTGSSHERGREFLEKYGYFGDGFFMKNSKSYFLKSFLFLVLCPLAVFAAFAGYCFFISRRRKRAVGELIDYLRSVENGVYSLKISENSEEDISKLTNEIYKITVLLRETALESNKREKALSSSLADISHQIKTPLTSVSIMLDNIIDAPEMDENTKRDFINEIRRQISLISSLCVSLLLLSRFDSGTVEFTRSPVTAGEIISAAADNLSVLLDIKNVSLSVSGDTSSQLIVDKRWQTEALSNIIKNAAEHCGDGGNINIDVENSGLFVKLRISDSGEGIDESDLPHIFERFYKAKNAGPDSFGIGLSLAKTVIEKDNGTVRVTSKKGEGATFTVAYRLI